MKLLSRVAGLVAVCVLVVSAAGCGSDNAPESKPPSVAASNSLLRDMVTRIGGSAANVAGMAPTQINTHTWTPDTQTSDAMVKSAVIFRTGGDFEPWFESTYKQSGSTKPVVDLSKSVKLLRDRGHANSHWMTDIPNLKLAAAKVADELTKLNPGGAATYQANLKKFNEDAQTVDDSLKYCISLPNPKNLRVVAAHDDLDYLARRYGFKVVAQLTSNGTEEATDADRPLAAAKRGKAKVVTTPWAEGEPAAGAVAAGLKVPKVAIFTDAVSNVTFGAKNLLGSIEYSVNAIVGVVSQGKAQCT